MIGMHRVEANTVSPDAERIMKKVQKLFDQKAGFWQSTFVIQKYEELLSTMWDEELHPYAKQMIWKISSSMEERYAFMNSVSSMELPSQVVKNGKIMKRNQRFDIAHSSPVKEQKQEADKFVAPQQIQIAKKVEPVVQKEKIVEKKEETVVKKKVIVSEQNESKSIAFTQVEEQNAKDKDQWYSLGNWRINISQLRRTWIKWVNDFRKEEWVTTKIAHQPLLDKTATEYSYYQRSLGERTHRRTPYSAFYDYDEITQWFNDRWIDFKNVNRATHTENVWLSTLYCDWGDCTDEATTSLSWVFDYFINEKWTHYTAHYDTIVQPYFGEMGFGIAIDESTDTIYSTMHYATEAIRRPAQLTSR